MKTIMIRDSGAWQMQVWTSFAIAVFLCGVGLAYLPGADLDRVFMIMGYLFCLSNVFVLSKMIRDNQKARMEGRTDTPMFKYVVWSGFLLVEHVTVCPAKAMIWPYGLDHRFSEATRCACFAHFPACLWPPLPARPSLPRFRRTSPHG